MSFPPRNPRRGPERRHFTALGQRIGEASHPGPPLAPLRFVRPRFIEPRDMDYVLRAARIWAEVADLDAQIMVALRAYDQARSDYQRLQYRRCAIAGAPMPIPPSLGLYPPSNPSFGDSSLSSSEGTSRRSTAASPPAVDWPDPSEAGTDTLTTLGEGTDYVIPSRRRLSVTRLTQRARVSENRRARPWSVRRITGRTGSGLSWSGPSRSLMGRRIGCATRAEPGCVDAGRGYPSPPPTGPALSAMALGFGPTPRPPPSPLDSRVGAGAPRGAPPREGTLAGCWTSCTPLPA